MWFICAHSNKPAIIHAKMLVLNVALKNTEDWRTSKVRPVFDILQGLLLGADLASRTGLP